MGSWDRVQLTAALRMEHGGHPTLPIDKQWLGTVQRSLDNKTLPALWEYVHVGRQSPEYLQLLSSLGSVLDTTGIHPY